MNLFSFFGDEKRPKLAPLKEAGTTGTLIYAGYVQDRERNPKLSFQQRPVEYENLLSNVAIVGAGIRYMSSLCAAAEWSIEPNENDKDEFYADLARRMMEEVSTPWPKIVKIATLYYHLGFSLQEMTARKADDGILLFDSIDQRPQRTIERFDDDKKTGKILGFGQRSPDGSDLLYIPREKTLYLVDDLLTDSPAGMGVLRHVFETCERLKNYLDIEYAAYARDLRGIPIGRVPYAELNKAVKNGEITAEQSAAATSAMENLMRSSKKLPDTAIILDSSQYVSRSDTGLNVSSAPQWGLEILQGNGDGFADLNTAIERLQTEIARVLSCENLMLSGGGSQALSKDKSANTYLTANSILNEVHSQATKDIIAYFWKLNAFPVDMMPKFNVEEISSRDAESVAKVLRDMAGAGALLDPSDPVINEVRQAMGLSEADLAKADRKMTGAE